VGAIWPARQPWRARLDRPRLADRAAGRRGVALERTAGFRVVVAEVDAGAGPARVVEGAAAAAAAVPGPVTLTTKSRVASFRNGNSPSNARWPRSGRLPGRPTPGV